MKILSLKGKNLASLEGEFEINFNQEPLSSAGIFAITGSTGAGKSTLLDAICLALFDDAPRTHKATENIAVVDVQDKTINQKDSRNILRRGAIDGYAQLEFIALNGKTYRSTWSVKRARAKLDGALQAVEMRLENLSEGRDEQGKKTEILARIVELIGLNFEQFTRAVLLAQGDFATFLKAKQGEKAELLEKLTGTHIYSQISARIYEKTQQAKQELTVLSERMKDIKLLSEEELVQMQAEKTVQTAQTEVLKHQIANINKQLEWIATEQQLRKEVSVAENDWVTLKGDLENAKNRFEYIEKVDAVQEIRDIYLELKRKKVQWEEVKLFIDFQSKKLISLSENLQKIKQEQSDCQKQIKQQEEQYQLVLPEIEKAKSLDMELKSQQERQIELQTELAKQQQTLENLFAQKDKISNDQKTLSEKLTTLNQWFQDKQHIGRLVPFIDRLVAQLKDYDATQKQVSSTTKSITTTESLLKTRLEVLTLNEAELEKLQKELPSEVILLREKLEEGKPCPVCGSTHHPHSDESLNISRLQEEQLEKEKKKLQETIDTKKKEIELGKEELTRLKATSDSYQQRMETILSNISSPLEVVPNWQDRLAAGTLIEQLLKTQKIWNENTENLQKSKELESNLTLQLSNSNQNIEASQKTLQEQTAKKEQATKRYAELQGQRVQLLGGKPANEVQQHIESERKQLNEQLAQIQQRSEEASNEHALRSGELEEAKRNVLQLESSVSQLETIITAWISSNQQHIDLPLLEEIALKTADWIKSEKSSLQQLKDAELAVSTKLSERKKRLVEHLQSFSSKYIADEQELKNQLSETESKNEIAIKRLNEVDFILQDYQRNQARHQSFEVEKKSKEEIFNNWAKLNELLGSASGAKFKEIAQGYTLDVLVVYANKQLHELTHRYRLQRISETLALQVVDEDMMGETRSVHSLSGGESFLISLSLALGLSSLSSNRMKIESLFIDEGFASLDVDTLNVALDALENLQSQGRKIGVISHIPEMTERIKTQIRVIKLSNGRSRVEVVT